MKKPDILLVGCGKMGGAMLEGWLKQDLAGKIVVVEPHPPTTNSAVTYLKQAEDIPVGFTPDIIIFAVKPQVLDDVARAYKGFAGKSLFLSIAAGKTIGKIEAAVGKNAAIIRTMPNLPASIGQGVTAAYANSNVTPQERILGESLLSAIGETVWIEREDLMDAVTAVSGSGPAYIFLLTEALEQAAQKAGLPPELAAQLARKTVTGSARLLEESPLDPARLRQNVTSPGGTTAAALEILMKNGAGMKEMIDQAVAAAANRSKELSE